MIFLLVLTACGGTAVEDSTSTSGTGATPSTVDSIDTTIGESPQMSESPSTTEASDETTTTASDLPLAPEFTLELGTGGEYRLSDSQNPVYLVFWAEW